MTTSENGNLPAIPPRPSVWRVLASIAGRMVATLVTGGVVLVLPTMLFTRAFTTVYESILLLHMSIGSAVAFLVGGAVARRLAGPHLWKGRLGVATVFSFLILQQIISLISYLRGHYTHWWWMPFRETTGNGSYTIGLIIYNVVINAIILIISAAIAQLGDAWMLHRLTRKTSPVSPQE